MGGTESSVDNYVRQNGI